MSKAVTRDSSPAIGAYTRLQIDTGLVAPGTGGARTREPRSRFRPVSLDRAFPVGPSECIFEVSHDSFSPLCVNDLSPIPRTPLRKLHNPMR